MVYRERPTGALDDWEGPSLQIGSITESDRLTTTLELDRGDLNIELDTSELALDLAALEVDLDSLGRRGFLQHVDRALKRMIDVVIATVVLTVTSPLFLLIAALIKLTSRGPVVFSHRRIGAAGRYFDCYKFRTMVRDADLKLDGLLSERPDLRKEFAKTQKLKDDPRVTRIGALLRKTSLDEFPQFWNVLKGDMSIVGPRPIVDDEMTKYGRWLPLILELRPGITGLWQVSGRNDTTYAERVALDRRYALTRTIATDFSIMAKTPTVMLKRNGAY